ncbi:uncharacterized protein LOC6573250 isoform X2 [Drosophila mojavensis]|uniref:Uncharacterized protein, isoform C n=1 Tax=Drosophila mojavensis TaxID=7230 RepID=A0A0Q9X9W9_DROMO|nr:uncharacterized protein LOC6573250 isoform X2 [Drosophila mojavensis]XP_043863346.1 uncharacterized protein LOC6573250 isoform X2 [Drosophila mojavensis]KRG01207.1 uncharacterized protein Dmoj_GI23123, isoform C [Drosophila mojavensis]
MLAVSDIMHEAGMMMTARVTTMILRIPTMRKLRIFWMKTCSTICGVQAYKVRAALQDYAGREMLPEGWVQVTHNSVMPLFLYRKTRVCSASRPYFLGTGSARKHAVPCWELSVRRSGGETRS